MAGIVKNRGGREAVVLVFLLAATFFGCAKQQPVQVQPSPNANTEFPNANKALSLKVLSERARLFAGSSRFPEEVRHLAGLTKVTGYIIDRQNADIILTGRADKGAAPLDLDDLVTALRSAWLVYAKQQGAVCYVTPPGVTIDPDPAILHTLDQIKEKAFRQRNPLAIKEGLKEWERIAKSPQKARVLGLPPCRMAKIALDADYFMKRIVDGSANLGIPGLLSLSQIRQNILDEDHANGRRPSIPQSSFNRFWFAAGRNTFQQGDSMIRILSSPVTLKTEEELLVSRSKIAGRGSTDPLAMQFCDRFTKDYQAIAEQRTVYRELENMFRWVALAQIMKQQNAPEQSGMSLDYFLSQCEVVRPEISSSLPGIASVHRVETKRNSTTLYHWSMTVGGVDMNIVIRGEDVKPDADGSVRKLEQSALAARPSRSALCWVFM